MTVKMEADFGRLPVFDLRDFLQVRVPLPEESLHAAVSFLTDDNQH